MSADDFEYLWRNLNGSVKGNDVASTTGYDQIESVEGSDNGKTVTVVFKEPFTDWKSLFYGLLPARYMAEVPGGWNTGLDKNPERIPVNGPYRVSAWEQGQSLTLARNDKYFGPKAHLDSIVFRFLPESTTQPAALLERAGYSKGADGVYAKDGRPLSLRISTTAGNQLRETQEQLVQAQLKQIGVDIKIVNADSTKFFGEWLPQGNFDIANFGWVGNPFAISSSQDIYRTGGGGNYGAYESSKVDGLFAQAVREVDEARSAELGNQIDQQLTADMATIPLYAKPTYLAVRDRFANVGDNATQEGPFWNSGLWAQKAA